MGHDSRCGISRRRMFPAPAGSAPINELIYTRSDYPDFLFQPQFLHGASNKFKDRLIWN